MQWLLEDIEKQVDLLLKKKRNPAKWKKNIEKVKKMKRLEYCNYKGEVHNKKLIEYGEEIQRCRDTCHRNAMRGLQRNIR